MEKELEDSKQGREGGQILKMLLAIQDQYAEDTHLFLRFLEEKKLGFTLQGVQAYYEHLYARYQVGEIKAATFNKRISGVKNRVRRVLEDPHGSLTDAMRFLLDAELKRLSLLRTPGPAVDGSTLPTEEELSLLVEKTQDMLVKTLVPFLAETGLRISEALGIRISDITEAKSFSRITVRGKGNKEREILAASWLMKRATESFAGANYLFEHQGRPYSRKASSGRIAEEARAILGRRMSAHTLRHYFATRMLAEGKSLKAVSRFLGHASTAITADIYVHDALSAEDVASGEREVLYGAAGMNGKKPAKSRG